MVGVRQNTESRENYHYVNFIIDFQEKMMKIDIQAL
jgi:hypothetical protein